MLGWFQRRYGSRLAFKPLVELLLGDFDGDIAPQARVLGAIYLAHPALADERNDLVRPEFVTRGECHGASIILSDPVVWRGQR